MWSGRQNSSDLRFSQFFVPVDKLNNSSKGGYRCCGNTYTTKSDPFRHIYLFFSYTVDWASTKERHDAIFSDSGGWGWVTEQTRNLGSTPPKFRNAEVNDFKKKSIELFISDNEELTIFEELAYWPLHIFCMLMESTYLSYFLSPRSVWIKNSKLKTTFKTVTPNSCSKMGG